MGQKTVAAVETYAANLAIERASSRSFVSIRQRFTVVMNNRSLVAQRLTADITESGLHIALTGGQVAVPTHASVG